MGRIRPSKKPPAPSSWRNLSGVSPPEPCPHRQASQRHPLPARWRELRSPPPGAEPRAVGALMLRSASREDCAFFSCTIPMTALTITITKITAASVHSCKIAEKSCRADEDEYHRVNDLRFQHLKNGFGRFRAQCVAPMFFSAFRQPRHRLILPRRYVKSHKPP